MGLCLYEEEERREEKRRGEERREEKRREEKRREEKRRGEKRDESGKNGKSHMHIHMLKRSCRVEKVEYGRQ